MKEFQFHEIYRDGSELEMIAYLTGDEFEAYAKAHHLRRISTRTEINDAGFEFEIYAYIIIEDTPAPMHSTAYYRHLRNYLQTLACTVNVYSKEYRNLCARIKWINIHRL